MSNIKDLTVSNTSGDDNPKISRRVKWLAAWSVVAMIVATTWVIVTSPASPNSGPATSTTVFTPPAYSAGVVNPAEPSGLGPLPANAVPGFVESYVNDFSDNALPVGWYTFTGVPGGDPSGQFSSAHVVVNNGLLELNAWKDPAFHNRWVTGGLCLCGRPQTYGAYFVRSRQTGSGPNEVELLWPQDNSWPPEVDFNETGGASLVTSATVHWTIANHLIQNAVQVDLKQWHTWGVVWTPHVIKYTLDGRVWATDTLVDSIPNQPMTLDFEQRTICDPRVQCPSVPTSLLIDWVVTFAKAN